MTAELLDAGAAHAVFAGASKTALTGALRRILASEARLLGFPLRAALTRSLSVAIFVPSLLAP